jgi:hypothetical protein
MSEDEGLAEHILAQPEPTTKPPARRWSEYSVVVEMLTAIFDRLGEVPNAIAAANGAKPRKIKPAARPVTAVEKVRERRAHKKHRSVVARVLPQGADTSAFLQAAEGRPGRRRPVRAQSDPPPVLS